MDCCCFALSVTTCFRWAPYPAPIVCSKCFGGGFRRILLLRPTARRRPLRSTGNAWLSTKCGELSASNLGQSGNAANVICHSLLLATGRRKKIQTFYKKSAFARGTGVVALLALQRRNTFMRKKYRTTKSVCAQVASNIAMLLSLKECQRYAFRASSTGHIYTTSARHVKNHILLPTYALNETTATDWYATLALQKSRFLNARHARSRRPIRISEHRNSN